jgi:hypothetical protein
MLIFKFKKQFITKQMKYRKISDGNFLLQKLHKFARNKKSASHFLT